MSAKEISEKENRYSYGTGRRKSAVAQVRVFSGEGKLFVDDKEVDMYPEINRLIESVGLTSKIDIHTHVKGGGSAGQIIAIRHGVARALVEKDAELRTTIKKAGYLTRDPRERERKKYGLHSARRAQQFSKR
jgi:small subunit ribosomal protein S9